MESSHGTGDNLYGATDDDGLLCAVCVSNKGKIVVNFTL